MIKLFRHQQVALNHLRFNSGFMLIMEQGTGKTLPTLVRVLELLKDGKIKNALVVCPKSVIGSWERDVQKFTPKQQKLFNERLTVINYDKVWRDKTFDKTWDCLVLDEAHAIKNRTSKRASFLLKLATRASYRYLLTGTPISNGRLEDWWSLLTFIYPVVSGGRVNSQLFKELIGGRGSYTEFINRYAFLDQYFKPYRYRNVSEIQKLVNGNSFRVLKEQCLDLPEKLPDEIISVEMDSKCRKLYNDIAKNSASLDFGYIAENPLTRMLKLRQLSSGYFMTTDSITEFKDEKLDALNDFLDARGSKKLVIFAEFIHTINNISNVLKRRGINHVILNGKQKNKNIWRTFQTDENCQIIICNYASGCSGIDLFSADTILYYEPCIRENQLSQSRDRIHRVGQKTKCSYFHFLVKNSIEEKIYSALIGYSDFNEKLFNQYLDEYQRSRRKGKK